MRLVAITTYPPSSYAHSSFAYHALQRFLEWSALNEIIILSDIVAIREKERISDRCLVDHCWEYDSPFTLFNLVQAVLQYKPDVVWINLHYTHFAKTPISIVLSLLLPLCLRYLQYPVVTLLHNLYAVTEPRKMGLKIPDWIIRLVDKLLMKSIMSSSVIFTMVKSHSEHMRQHFPHTKIICVDQDLYKPSTFYPVSTDKPIILTIGYFGYHKRLETLLEAFQLVRVRYPTALLKIAGTSHPLLPNYLSDIVTEYKDKLQGIEFLGYVSDDNVSALFASSAIIVAPIITHVGSSATLQYAAMFGRGVILPRLGFFESLNPTEWGIDFFEPNNYVDLAEVLCNVLADPIKLNDMAQLNLKRIINSQGTFVYEHLKVFEELAKIRI